MPKVSFRLSEKETIDVNVEIGERIMDIARNSGIYIDAPCSGNGTCGKCRVQILSGDAESHPSRHITDEDYAAGWRLACETRVIEDVTVLVPETASAFRTASARRTSTIPPSGPLSTMYRRICALPA